MDDERPMYFDRQGQPMTLLEWAAAREDYASRIVERTVVGDAVVLTLWMGFDSDPMRLGPPMIFGSVIKFHGSFFDEMESPTESGARAMHALLVAIARELVIQGGR